MRAHQDVQKLIDFNCQVLDQASQVIEAYAQRADLDFAAHAGPHLRHVFDHYRAFVDTLPSGSVNYDDRGRDPRMEHDRVVAHECMVELRLRLQALETLPVEKPIAVILRGGMAGEDGFMSFSTVARELLFLASHATHHYALIRLHCAQHGIDLGPDFGKAPSTIRHEQQA